MTKLLCAIEIALMLQKAAQKKLKLNYCKATLQIPSQSCMASGSVLQKARNNQQILYHIRRI